MLRLQAVLVAVQPKGSRDAGREEDEHKGNAYVVGFWQSWTGLDGLCATLLNRVHQLVLVLVLVLKGDGGSVERVTRGGGFANFSAQGLSCQM